MLSSVDPRLFAAPIGPRRPPRCGSTGRRSTDVVRGLGAIDILFKLFSLMTPRGSFFFFFFFFFYSSLILCLLLTNAGVKSGRGGGKLRWWKRGMKRDGELKRKKPAIWGEYVFTICCRLFANP